MKEAILYCTEHVSGKYRDFSPSGFLTYRYGGSYDPSKRVLKVRIAENATGTHWAWWDHAEGCFSGTMVFQHRALLSICFAEGLEAAEKSGRGLGVQVRVEELEVCNPNDFVGNSPQKGSSNPSSE